MKSVFTLLLILFVVHHSASAQERTISGRLTSTDDGSPLPGVSVYIKGTSIGTVTDLNGNYSIKVSVGSTLVFAFIGMVSREVVVTENNFQPAKGTSKENDKGKKRALLQPVPKSLYRDSIASNGRGVSTLTDETPSYNPKGNIDPDAIRSIKKLGNSYFIKIDSDPVRRTGFGLQFSSTFGVEQVNKLPSFQHQFAQGQSQGGNFQWRGADQNEIFSWGPLVRTLEFDGSDYPFDKNGRLVPAGSGNGKSAKNYDPLSFFRTGSTTVNELMLTLPGPKSGILIFDFEHRTRTGIIPNSQYRRINLSSSLKNCNLANHVRLSSSVSFNNSTGDLLNRGANLASIVGGVYRTPVTFDNANALSPKSALLENESFAFENGSKRSHTPGLSDNPYGLVNELPDQEELQRLLGSLNLQYQPSGPFSIVFNGTLDQQWNSSHFGTPPQYSGYLAGRLTDRKDNQTFADAIITPTYRHYADGQELKISLSYQTQYTYRALDRTDGFDFSTTESFGDVQEADSLIGLRKNLSRYSHEIVFNALYEYEDWLTVRFANRNYFSNTINTDQYTNLFPSGSLSLDLVNMAYISWPFDMLKVYSTLSRTMREAPLLYSNWSYGSTVIPMEKYASFSEAQELFFSQNIAPETERKFETGVKLQMFSGQLSLELAYFNNLTKDFIAPVNTASGFALSNAAAISNEGGTLAAGYSVYMGDINWNTELRWSKTNSVVQEIYSADEWIALSGFQSVQSVLARDKPMGAIYGTSYQRNSEGKKIIGSDGFPLEDTNLKMIGNPIPNWILGWSANIRWKELKFSFLFDFKKGGDIWNGTHSALDYLGRSSNTGELRNTANYIFEGVDINGNPNVIPVNFSDPTKPVADNRWVRYGWDGIGEDCIEDGSWIRLSELVLSYSIRPKSNRAAIKDIRFSLTGRNLFLITPYSGVDPSATLFGYGTGNGLDLFNVPSTRSYSAQVTIKI